MWCELFFVAHFLDISLAGLAVVVSSDTDVASSEALKEPTIDSAFPLYAGDDDLDFGRRSGARIREIKLYDPPGTTGSVEQSQHQVELRGTT